MNSHSELRKLLSAYCGGDLAFHEQLAVEAHLKECAACRAELDDLKTTLHIIRTTPEVEPPPWLTSRIMAHVRVEQAEKPGWLKRLFFPLHIKLPLEAVGLLVVCVTGYYLSRSVETGLRIPPNLHEAPATAPAPAVPAEAAPPAASSRDTVQHPPPAAPSAVRPESMTDKGAAPGTELQPLQQPDAPATGVVPGFAPSPPARKLEQSAPAAGSAAQPLRSAPSAERMERNTEAAPEMKKKARGIVVPQESTIEPSAAGKDADRAEPAPLPQLLLSLIPEDRSTTGETVRSLAIRSGAVVTDDARLSTGRIAVRIPAARFAEFHGRLARIGRLSDHHEPPAGAQMLEVTIQW